MRSLKEITLELDLLFARLFRIDERIEMLEQQKVRGGQQDELEHAREEQRQIANDLKNASSDFWKAL